ncbi:MAG: cytochrome C oxidase subunit IV family protein [Wenzhouxiangellaceae bacterium]|nr:cytochrome C oxidase subunit IV family protein [Wenzhouxiangellaceae bacterium]
MRALLLTFAALLALLALTVWIGSLELGRVTIALSLGVAFLKAALIVTVFMHLRDAGTMIRIAALGGFLWLGVLFWLTFGDVARRDAGADAPLEPTLVPPRDGKSSGSGE